MKCRKMKIWTDETGLQHCDLVMFGSYGVNPDGTAIRVVNDGSELASQKEDIAEGEDSLQYSIRQKLSVIKNELWYNYKFGIPLVDKIVNKAFIDAYIITTVKDINGVRTISNFVSQVENKTYRCSFVINNELSISL